MLLQFILRIYEPNFLDIRSIVDPHSGATKEINSIFRFHCLVTKNIWIQWVQWCLEVFKLIWSNASCTFHRSHENRFKKKTCCLLSVGWKKLPNHLWRVWTPPIHSQVGCVPIQGHCYLHRSGHLTNITPRSRCVTVWRSTKNSG